MIYYYWKAEISKEDCETLIEEFDFSSAEEASMGNYPATEIYYPEQTEIIKKEGNWDYLHNKPKAFEGRTDLQVRRTELNWLPINHKFNKILCDYVIRGNEIQYHYNLTKFTPCQFAKYNVGDFYNFHQDSEHSHKDYEEETRKLSMTVQLSDPETYEGGEFYFYDGDKKTEPLLREQGSIIIFDSREWHRISPVTEGVRYSLASWTLGPAFK
jgi:predicted 2-oxoglutarate/Fe(II)-dependent dioxygenase YbiX